ncbi:uncharacterized protein A4U43_C09F3320 [Asparagus officinalis]|uniref:Uncharacterized protein n=1 Tax=Asparagus officinalis TaxID=4686 RepID=A0A5P1E6T3_ASPOF|nr:uncharacterized protein A4U43_C09F3320 [Asparagus officinalis]
MLPPVGTLRARMLSRRDAEVVQLLMFNQLSKAVRAGGHGETATADDEQRPAESLEEKDFKRVGVFMSCVLYVDVFLRVLRGSRGSGSSRY